MIRVAIASENTDYDAALYRELASRVLGVDLTLWESTPRTSFTGWQSVVRQAPIYLKLAADVGVRHAIVAIDNDGGAQRHLPHRVHHEPAAQAADQAGCRTCLLLEKLKATFTGVDARRCIVVPVQAIETWLLALRGFNFRAPSPEQYYGRQYLKREFFGPRPQPVAERTRLALEELRRPEALDVLRQRPSFRHFEQQLEDWK